MCFLIFPTATIYVVDSISLRIRIMTDNRIIQLKTNPSPGYVYLISAVGTGVFKIGRTKVSVAKRLKGLQTGSPIKLRYVYHAYVENVDMTELELHRNFSLSRKVGEWFALTPTEVKECILLMRLVQKPEPINVFASDDIEKEKTEDDVQVEEQTDLGVQIKVETERRFCSQRLRKNEAVALIEKLRKTLNQTQIIETLWDCTVGGSRTYKQARAEYHELMVNNPDYLDRLPGKTD